VLHFDELTVLYAGIAIFQNEVLLPECITVTPTANESVAKKHSTGYKNEKGGRELELVYAKE